MYICLVCLLEKTNVKESMRCPSETGSNSPFISHHGKSPFLQWPQTISGHLGHT